MKLHVLGLLFLGLVAGQDDGTAGDGLDARISAERAKIRNDFKPRFSQIAWSSLFRWQIAYLR